MFSWQCKRIYPGKSGCKPHVSCLRTTVFHWRQQQENFPGALNDIFETRGMFFRFSEKINLVPLTISLSCLSFSLHQEEFST